MAIRADLRSWPRRSARAGRAALRATRAWSLTALRAIRAGSATALHATATTLRATRGGSGTAAGGTRAWFGRPAGRRLATAAAVVAVTLAGVTIGLLVGAHVRQDVGPFEAEFSITPTVAGGTDVQLPPLGSLKVRSHSGPAHLTIDLAALDAARTRALLVQPDGVNRASATAVDDITQGVARLVLQSLGAGLLGAMALAALVFRSMRRVAVCGGLALVVVTGSLATALVTFRQQALAEPRYQGLLQNARAVVGDARRIADQYDAYRDQLQRMVTNVSRLYTTISTLPVYVPPDDSIRVLHISDLHLNPAAWSVVETVVDQFDIDVVVDTGDITDWGTEPEASFVAPIGALGIPYVYVRGNHDSELTAAAVAREPNATVLDNSVTTVEGLTIAGISDPRFTPDKSAEPEDPLDAARIREGLRVTGARLARMITERPATEPPVDIALVHDPGTAGPLAGVVPLVAAGHLHKRDVSDLEVPPDSAVPRTQLFVEGSTGGAGLRGLENGEPLALQLSVLYFGPDHVLQAYDSISVGGTGLAEVALERHLVQPAAEPEPVPTGPR
jgi:predicted phosphodiesterase